MNDLIVFSYDFPPLSGGISRLCHEIAKGQKKYFSRVIVLCKDTNKNDAFFDNSPFEVIRLPIQRLKSDYYAIKFLRNFSSSKTTILCSLWYPEAFLALLSNHKNIYCLAHGAELLHGKSIFRKYIWHRLFAHTILNKIKKIISNSNYTKDLVAKISRKANCVALPLGVDIDVFKPLDSKKNDAVFTIGSLSRIHYFKGYDKVLQSINKLPYNLQEKIVWNIGGTGPYLSDFKLKIKNLKLPFKVNFLEFIKDEDLPFFYNKLDLFILFTQDIKNLNSVEGFGLVFLEAQSCGVPAIGSKTGGIPDAIDNEKGGWVFHQDDVLSLSKKIEELILNKSILIEQSVLARSRCVAFASWEKYNMKLNNLLN